IQESHRLQSKSPAESLHQHIINQYKKVTYEQRIENPRVPGSIPGSESISTPTFAVVMLMTISLPIVQAS
ncbi:hypothetical protein L9G74_20925, partial [Shewanella sp. C32]